MKQILYSYPPGTGGDHICAMLMNRPIQLQGQRSCSVPTIRHAEHQVRIGESSLESYLDELRRLRGQRPVIINSHELDMPGREDMTCVRAVWTDPDLSWRWVCRDIMLNSWYHDVMPYIDGDMRQWLTAAGISQRRRLLQFLENQHRYGVWHAGESVPPGWHCFYLDRIFTPAFVDDVIALADVLSLEVDYDLVASNHQAWMAKNRPRDFTLPRAVRHLEAARVLSLL